MKLSLEGLRDPAYGQKGYRLPAYDIPAMRERTLKAPSWLHFGAGNIFRAFPAAALDTLLSNGDADKGVIVAESYDDEILDTAYHPYDELSLLVTLKSDGQVEKRVVGSVAASYAATAPEVRAAFMAKSLQIVSFTVTEKGYSAYDDDFENPQAIMSRVTRLLYGRYLSCAAPLTLLSMDNCSHNGDKIKAAVTDIAGRWAQKGLVDAGFVAYVTHPGTLAYPWTMIDKITPRPDEKVRAALESDGFLDTRLIHTQKHTFTAPFVNAEETEYLVIEDTFPNGRPAFEKAGFLFTDRETVDKVERMKVCTCLNPNHTALAIFGCLLGYKLISDEMKDPDLNAFVTKMAYQEALPVVTSPGILDPEAFLHTVLTVRFPNPFMPDTPQRIATDTSQKLCIRFGETIKAYMRDDKLDAEKLELIPIVLAGWLRYLTGLDDQMQPFELSPDPLLHSLLPLVQKKDFAAILENEVVFGVDLKQAGLYNKVLKALDDMQSGPGAVRSIIKGAVR